MPTKHGHAKRGNKATEYSIWGAMKQRCSNPKNGAFVYYGGRGIKVCDRWLDSFENFLADVGPRPSINHSIDRINSDGDYEPSNCRWATASQQALNRRTLLGLEARFKVLEDRISILEKSQNAS